MFILGTLEVERIDKVDNLTKVVAGGDLVAQLCEYLTNLIL